MLLPKALLISAVAHILLFFGCSCTQGIKRQDSHSAIAAGDLTAIAGCGEQIGVGYVVCRMPEGASAETEYLTIHAPPDVKCQNENACLYFRIYFPDGRPTYEGTVKKGESFTRVPWCDVINKKTFDLGDRGFYGVSVTLHYIGPEGLPMKSYSDGYLFLHVTRRDYLSLLENEEDENFVWTWKTPTHQTIKLTSGFRVFLSPSQREK